MNEGLRSSLSGLKTRRPAAVLCAIAVFLLITMPLAIAGAQDADVGTPPANAPIGAIPALAASERYAQAIAAFDKGDLGTAQRLFEEVIALDPAGEKAAQARHHLGQLYSQQKPPGSPAVPASPETPQTETAIDAPADVAPSNRARVNARYRSDDDEFIGEVGDRVFFSTSSADLGGRAVAIVEAQAAWLKQKPSINASVAGYADEPNLSPEQNEALSEARAIAVRDRLILEGIAKERLSIVPWGRDGRVAPCPEPQCQVQNRRAVTVLVPRNRLPPQRHNQPALTPKRLLPTQ